MDHFKIFKRAWDIVWKYRTLLLIGLVLVLVGGAVGGRFMGAPGGGSPGGGGSSSGSSGEGGDMSAPDWDVVWDKIVPIVIAVLIVIAILFVLSILLALARFVLRYVTRAALIKMVDRYEETEEQIGFMEGLRLGWSGPAARRLFIIRLILALPLILLTLLGLLAGAALTIVLVVLVIVVANSGGGGAVVAAVVFGIALFFIFMLILMPLSLIAILLRVIISVVQEIAFRICALQGKGAWESIQEAVALIRRNLWPTALQALLLFGLGIAWNIALFIVIVPLALLAFFIAGLPALILGSIVALFTSPILALILGMFIFGALVILLLALPGVAFATFATVYHSTVWTLTYRELLVIDAGEDRETELIEFKANLG